MEEAIATILRNVDQVPKCGHPGTFVVFDSHAYPILTGTDSSDILLAAAEYGLGRVIAISHEAYIEKFIKNQQKFEPLWSNIKNWLSKGEPICDEDIKSMESFESISEIDANVKILIWNGTFNKSELFINQLLKKYVSTGGSVLCGICPWGWLSLSRRTLDDMPMNIFLSLIGICVTSDLCKFDSNSILVANNQANKAHFGHAIVQISLDLSRITELERILTNGINYLLINSATKYLDRIHKILYSNIVLKYVPTSKIGIVCPIGRSLLALCSRLYQKYSNCALRIKAPDIEEFPGDFLEKPETSTVILSIKSKFDEFHSTGYYAPAGSSIKVTVLDGNPAGWNLRIGCHSDDLSTVDCLNRWPIVFSCVKLKKCLSVATAFGGLIYLDSPKGYSTLKIKLESVVEAPYFDLTKPEAVQKWETNRNSPGLWAELCGQNVVFTVPSNSVRNLNNPTVILKLWDLIISANHELRGTDCSNTWKERIVIDIQPFGGAMHSGYPIVIPCEYADPESSLFLLNAKSILTNGWNLLHELGHNMQRTSWTPRGTEEVMPNLFALHALDYVFKDNKWLENFLNEIRIEKLLKNYTFSFDQWEKSPQLAFFLYLQLLNAFGWNAFKAVFREYESGGEMSLKNDTARWNKWISKFSIVTGLNVTPLFYFWSIPFSEENLSDAVKELTPWLPDDKVANYFPDRIEAVKGRYQKLLLGNETIYMLCQKVIY